MPRRARCVLPGIPCHVTQRDVDHRESYYEFNVYSDRKVTEKLRYMHRNPVERGLVSSPELWRWSSYRAFAFLEEGTVKLNWQQPSNKGKTGKVPKQEIANGISAHPPNTTESRAPTLWFVHHKTK